MVACVFLILSACTSSNVVIPSTKPADAFEPSRSEQAPDYCQAPIPPASKQPGYQQVEFVVRANGLPSPALVESDLHIEQNAKEMPIVYFRQEPVSLGIVLDTSASMESKIDSMRVLVAELVNRLNPADQLFLIAFSSRPFILTEFTGLHDRVVENLSLLRAFGPANYPEAVQNGKQVLQNGCYQDKTLLVIGDDNESLSEADRAEMTSDISKFQMKLLVVGIGKVNTETLRAVVGHSSGGLMLIDPGEANARVAGDLIASELHNRYSLGFVTVAASPVRLELLNHPFGLIRVESKPADITIMTNN